VTVATSMINAGDNIISVVTKNADQWAFFDLQIQVQYSASCKYYFFIFYYFLNQYSYILIVWIIAFRFLICVQLINFVLVTAPPVLIPQGSIWLYYNKGVVSTNQIYFRSLLCDYLFYYFLLIYYFKARNHMDSTSFRWFHLVQCPCSFRHRLFCICRKDSFWSHRLLFPFQVHYPLWDVCLFIYSFVFFLLFILFYRIATNMTVSVASDNYAIVYINGFLVDSDPSTWHQATYWNRCLFFFSFSYLLFISN